MCIFQRIIIQGEFCYSCSFSISYILVCTKHGKFSRLLNVLCGLCLVVYIISSSCTPLLFPSFRGGYKMQRKKCWFFNITEKVVPMLLNWIALGYELWLWEITGFGLLFVDALHGISIWLFWNLCIASISTENVNVEYSLIFHCRCTNWKINYSTSLSKRAKLSCYSFLSSLCFILNFF